jgi:hypothetical protein
MNSLNSNFLKLLFVIVILILIYKSYFYNCRESFTDNNLLYYNKINGSNTDHIITDKNNKIVALLKNIADDQISNKDLNELNVKNNSLDQIILTKFDKDSISCSFHLLFDLKIDDTTENEGLIMYGLSPKDLTKNIFEMSFNNDKLKLVFINPINDTETIIYKINIIKGAFNKINLKVEDNKIKFAAQEKYLDFNFNIKYIVFGQKLQNTILPFTLKNIKYKSYNFSDKVAILDSQKKPRALWNNVYYFNRFFKLVEDDETPKTMLKLAYLNGITSNVQLLNLNDKKFTLQFFFKINNIDNDPILAYSPSGTWKIQIENKKIKFTINNKQFYPQPKNILDSENYLIENNKLYNFVLSVGFNDINIQINKYSFVIKYRDSTTVIETNNKRIRNYFNTFFREKNLLKSQAKKTIDKMFTDDTINYDSIYDTTKNLKDFDLNELMDLIDNRELNKILNTKEIIFGGKLNTGMNDINYVSNGLRGNIGLIIYYKTFVSQKVVCQLDTCMGKEELLDYNNDLEEYLNKNFTPTNFKEKYLNVNEDKIILPDKYKDMYSEDTVTMELPKKIELIVKADEKNISLFWQAPEPLEAPEQNALRKYVIVMQEKNKNSLNMTKEISVKNKNTLLKNFPYIYDKFEIENLGGAQMINTNNYYINDFIILGSGTKVDIKLSKIQTEIADPNIVTDLKFKLFFNITGGKGFKNGDKIKVANLEEITIPDEQNNDDSINKVDPRKNFITDEVKWSTFKLFFPKNETCTQCEYVFKKLSPHKKYRFSILTVSENKDIDFNYIGDNEFIEAELKTGLQKDIDILGEKSSEFNRVVCNSNGTHDVYNFDKSYDYKCNENIKSNIGSDHIELMNYLKPNDSIDIFADINLTL